MVKVMRASEGEHDALLETMRVGFDTQDEPKVGIFWYDPEKGELFGVYKLGVSKADLNHQGRKTINILHRKVWETEQKKAAAMGKTDSIWQGDYTQIPRGRVFQYPSGDMVVLIGSWISQYPQLFKMLLIEFDLPEDTTFMEGRHWELGHGWSE